MLVKVISIMTASDIYKFKLKCNVYELINQAKICCITSMKFVISGNNNLGIFGWFSLFLFLHENYFISFNEVNFNDYFFVHYEIRNNPLSNVSHYIST